MKYLVKLYIFIFPFYFFIPVTNAYMTSMILNEHRSILLPRIDTSAITENAIISEIGLNLYVEEFANKTQTDSVHLTVNPFDPQTNTIRDGVSGIYHPKSNQHLEIRLPKSLFEEITGTNERLLLKIVGKDQELRFSGSETTEISQDPFLTITYTEGQKQPEYSPTIINNYTLVSVDNSQLHFGNGDNIARDKISNTNSSVGAVNKESFISKFFWYFIIGIAVSVIGTFIIYKLGLNGNSSLQSSQTHYGLGDNIMGNKNVNTENEKSK